MAKFFCLPLFPFEYLLLPTLGERWCRRAFRDFQLVMVPSLEGKALGWKEHCSDKSQKSRLLILSAVLATALNYSLIVSFPQCLNFFRCDRAKKKIALFIFKSKRKFKLFIAKLRAYLHDLFPICMNLNNFLLSFSDKTIIQTDKLWTVITLCFSLQHHALNRYSLPLL